MTTVTKEDMEAILSRVMQSQLQLTETMLSTLVNHQTMTTNKYHEQFMAAMNEKEDRWKTKGNMTGRRAFATIPAHTGKPEEFELWRFQLLQFLSAEPGFPAMIEWIENTCKTSNFVLITKDRVLTCGCIFCC